MMFGLTATRHRSENTFEHMKGSTADFYIVLQNRLISYSTTPYFSILRLFRLSGYRRVAKSKGVLYEFRPGFRGEASQMGGMKNSSRNPIDTNQL